MHFNDRDNICLLCQYLQEYFFFPLLVHAKFVFFVLERQGRYSIFEVKFWHASLLCMDGDHSFSNHNFSSLAHMMGHQVNIRVSSGCAHIG